MGLFNSLEDYVGHYGPSVAIGAGLGFLGGGPVGALVGAGTGLAGQIGSEEAVKHLPAGTPDWAKTAVGFGVYGAFAGPEIAAQQAAEKVGAKVALEALFSRQAAREGAKVALSSGIGAAVGQEAAKVAGAPQWLGELAGGVLGPIAPGAARTVGRDFAVNRAAAYNSDSTFWQGLARTVGANDANSPKVGRTPVQMEASKIYGSAADHIASLRDQAANLRREVYKSAVDDDTVRALTGVTSNNPREYLLARARGQMPPEYGDAGVMTSELKQGKRRLNTLNTQLANAQANHETAQQALADLHTIMGPGEMVPLGQPKAAIPEIDQSLTPAQNGRNSVITLGDGSKIEWRGSHIQDVTAITQGQGTGTTLLGQAIARIRAQDPNAVVTGDLNSEGGARLFNRFGAKFFDRSGKPISFEEAVTQAKAAQGPMAEVPVGEIHPQGASQGFVWRGADGTEKLIPEAKDANYQGPTVSDIKLAQQNAAGAATSLDRTTKSLKTLLGVDELPQDEAQRLDLLRQKMLGPELAQVDASLMPPEQAQAGLKMVASQDAELAASARLKTANRDRLAGRLEDLATFMENNPEFGSLLPGQHQQAARDLAAIKSSEDLVTQAAKNGHRYVDIPNETALKFEDYSKLVQYIAQAQPTPERARAMIQSLLENPRGSVWLQDAEGTLQPRTLVGFDPKNGTALVRSAFQSADQADTVPMQNLTFRFDPQQALDMKNEIRTARDMSGLPTTDLPNPQPLSTRRLWMTQRDYDQAAARALQTGKPLPEADGIVEKDLAAAKAQFAQNFASPGTTIEMHAQTPEDAANQRKALYNIMSRPFRSGSTPEERAAAVAAQRDIRSNVDAIEGKYFPVDVREMAQEAGIQVGGFDPKAPFMDLMTQSDSDVVNLSRKATVGWTGTLGQAAERYGAGIVVQEPQAKAILSNYFGSKESSAIFTSGTYGFNRTQLANYVTKELGVRGGLVSKDGAFEKILQEHFTPENIVGPIGDQFRAMDDGAKAAVAPIWGAQVRTLFDHPEAYPKLSNLPGVVASRQQWRLLDEAIKNQTTILGASPLTASRRLSMMVTDNYRQFLNPDVLSPTGAQARQPNFLDVFDSVWQATGGDQNKLRNAFIGGRDADMSWATAAYDSMAEKRLWEKVASLAKPGETVTPADLSLGQQGWYIKNLNKWPEYLHDSLKGIMNIGSGANQWKGLQRLSQSIALGALSLDMSIVGVQGFKYAAHSLMAGQPFTAARVLTQGLTHVTTDYGFYSFIRQNMDELMYYSQLGLSGGLRGQIAGADINKIPIEHLPYVGGAMNALYGLSDLQYGRALYYWKVQGVRQNLDTINTLRAARDQVSEKFLQDVVTHSPTLKAISDSQGGYENFMLGTNEDTVKSVVRQVQRSYSSVDLRSEGVGAMRQAFEQIMTIVPGFFRGQVGQWASVITKPNTLEGHLALSMLAREYMFGGGVALGLSRMLGTEHKINWTDPSSATWLGVPLPDEMGGGTLSMLPTMAIPRLASRVVRDTVTGAQKDQFPNYSQALDSFAQGRLSPVISAFYDNMKGKDFLGRKYDSQLEKWGFTLANTTLPIVMQSALADATEEIKHAQATGTFDYKSVAQDSVANILGKSVIPQYPGDALNKISQSAFGTNWNLLTDAEKANLRQTNPGVATAEAEYNFYNSRRAGSAEAHITAAYSRYGSNVDSVWNQPQMISGIQSTQAQDDQAIAQGAMDGNTWRDRYHTRQQAAAQYYDQLTQELQAEGLDPAKIRQQRLDRITQNRPADRAVLLQVAKAEYSGIQLPTTLNQITTAQGAVAVQSVDWNAFNQAREDVLAKYPQDIQAAVRKSSLADQQPGIAAYQQASEAQRTIESLGRYRGLTATQGDKLDQLRAVISQTNSAINGQAGAAKVPASVLRQAALQQMQSTGLLQTQDDQQLAALAFAMSSNSKLADAMANPAQVSAILNNPQAVIFYPYLVNRVPNALQSLLPAQVFNAPLVEAQLAAAGP